MGMLSDNNFFISHKGGKENKGHNFISHKADEENKGHNFLFHTLKDLVLSMCML
jgi:hypothetical protein